MPHHFGAGGHKQGEKSSGKARQYSASEFSAQKEGQPDGSDQSCANRDDLQRSAGNQHHRYADA
jgi:hypothetical protein